MTSVIDISIERSRPVLLVLCLILVAGTISYITIPKEADPDIIKDLKARGRLIRHDTIEIRSAILGFGSQYGGHKLTQHWRGLEGGAAGTNTHEIPR